ncbi:MAG TPA: hypothetical protein PLP01_11700 [Phycisphaerae bacterium]|nr:hypothetical protein [Phycisphaerae bacterium]
MTTNAVKSFLEELRVGEPVKSRNLTVVPLLGGLDEKPQYETLDEALAAGTFTVTEVSAAGSVPELAVRNSGYASVLLLDGEELVGAKQNRILNLTILVAAGEKMAIPVSCVEQGRWRSTSAKFTGGHYSPAKLRRNKERSVRESFKATGRPASDQARVWEDVQEALYCSATRSPTHAMSDAYAERKADLRKMAEEIRLPEDACGMAAFVTAELVVVDLFAFRQTFGQVKAKLLDSYVLAALSDPAGQTDKMLPEGTLDSRKRTAEALERAAAARAESRPSVGLGTDVRLTGTDIRGAGLLHEGLVLHTSLFPDAPAGIADDPQCPTRMASPRRRNRKP